jgi:small subunit ribosomal protein S6
MRHYEVTFIVDPILSSDEVTSTAEHVQNDLKQFGASIVAAEEPALRQLAYSIKKRSSGVYYTIQFSCDGADWLGKFELNLQRNERILRFLTVKLDKYGIKYNDDKRNGLIGKRKREAAAAVAAAELAAEEALLAGIVDLDDE